MIPATRGRPLAVSDSILRAAVAKCEERDLRKDSCTSFADVMSVVNSLRRNEQNDLGLNLFDTLLKLCRSTIDRIVKQVIPVTIANGSI